MSLVVCDLLPVPHMQEIHRKRDGKKDIVDLRPQNGGFKIFNQGLGQSRGKGAVWALLML